MRSASSKSPKTIEEAVENVASSLTTFTNLLAELMKNPTKSNGSSPKSKEISLKEKRKRDPEFPKQPNSNYIFYCSSVRAAIDKEFPDKTFAEKSKVYGERWQKMSEAEKKPFNDLAKKEKERYLDEMAVYEKTHDVSKKAKVDHTPNKTKPAVAKVEPISKKAAVAKVPVAKETVAKKEESDSSDSSDDSDSDSSSDEEEVTKKVESDKSSSDSESEDSSSSSSDESSSDEE